MNDEQKTWLKVLLYLVAIISLVSFLCYLDNEWREKMGSAIFCPKGVKPNNVVERFHEHQEVKVLEKGTDEVVRTYGRVRLTFLSKDSFMIQDDNTGNPILLLVQLKPNEYVTAFTKTENFEAKAWGLK
jgi:hypothetical protein